MQMIDFQSVLPSEKLDASLLFASLLPDSSLQSTPTLLATLLPAFPPFGALPQPGRFLSRLVGLPLGCIKSRSLLNRLFEEVHRFYHQVNII